MHKEILDEAQISLLPLLPFARKKGFYMVGGTAIALYIGHRKSIDFDLFRLEEFRSNEIDQILKKAKVQWSARYIGRTENHTGVIDGVKCTFFTYPFEIHATTVFGEYIQLPSLLTLGAMKAYALGHRGKWKDYVDLYFILRSYYSLSEISTEAQSIFGGGYNESLFREQLCYYDDINYSESVEYLIPDPPSDDEIRRFLIDTALTD